MLRPDHLGHLPALTLVLGGARSGKSAYAEHLLAGMAEKIYLATAEAGDGEMAERIRLHQEQRGVGWITVEEPIALLTALQAHSRPDRPVLVDCLTLWLTNLLMAEADIAAIVHTLLQGMGTLPGPVIFVSNEVGLGLVPETPLGRRFRDLAGRLNQQIAARCSKVVFVAAGLPLVLKDSR